MPRLPPVLHAEARSILSPTTGFIRRAGFTRSLSPARNCTFACTYCYVPTMGIYGGLKPEDWKRWGQFTTFKQNASELLAREVRPDQAIYCSPLVDPYQPVEAEERMMPRLLQVLVERPPAVFAIQTRGPLIARDIDVLLALAQRTSLRISFSLTTDRDEVRRLYEPHCASFEERLQVMRRLRQAGLRVFATLAPLLPCDPEALAQAALEVTSEHVICDPFHTRVSKCHGATTREAGVRISAHHDWLAWHDPVYQADVIGRIRQVVEGAGRRLGVGPEGFGWLALPSR